VPVELAETLANAATLQEQWRFAAARELLATAGSADGTDRLAVATGRRMLAEVLRDLGELDEAHAVVEPLVAECEWRFGADHEATARALTVLATVVHAVGDLDGAEERYGRVLDGRFAETGPAGRAVRLARAYLALLYRDRGDLDRARFTLDAAYKSMRRAYGITDPDTIQFGVELARMATAAGDVPVARRLYAVARAGCQARLEAWHPLCVAVERELATVEPASRAAVEPASRAAVEPASSAAVEPASRAAEGPASAWSAPPAVGQAFEPERPDPARHIPTQRGNIPTARAADPRQPVPARPRPRRRRAVVAGVLAVALVAALVTALMVTAGWPGSGRHPTGSGPTAGTAGRGAAAPGNADASSAAPSSPSPDRPPLRVDLRDDGTKLVATWGVLPGGPAPIVVALSRAGQPATVVADLPAGATGYTVTKVDPRVEYCVIVAAVYPGETASGATSVCTQRAKATPKASSKATPKAGPSPSR
jgi:hypothetical protein